MVIDVYTERWEHLFSRKKCLHLGIMEGNCLRNAVGQRAVVGLLEGHFPRLVDFEFTASMEQSLDDVPAKIELGPTIRLEIGPAE